MIKSFYIRYKDYISTFSTEFIVLLAGILVYRFASTFFLGDGFSEYALCKRTISFLIPLLIMGLGVGIPRFVSLSYANNDFNKAQRIFISGALFILIITFLFCIIQYFFSNFFSYLYFGNKSYYYLIFPINCVILGLIIHSLIYSFYRGQMQFIKANFLQLLNLAIIPFISFFISNRLSVVLIITGLTNFIFSLIYFFIFRSKDHIKLYIFKEDIKELLNYGLQRVPGDFALSAFLAIPVYLVTHSAGIILAGYVAFAISLLTMTGAFFTPLSLILLPKITRIVASSDLSMLKKNIYRITFLTLTVTILGIIIFYITGDYILEVYLGKSNYELVVISKSIILSSIGYTLYVSLRSILDAFYVKAINTRNIFIAFISFLFSSIFSFYFLNFKFIIGAFILCIILLGLLTFIETIKIIKTNNI